MKVSKIVFFLGLWIFGLQISTAQNILQNKPVKVSSVNPRHPESLIVDGGISRSSTWMPMNDVRPPQWVEINLKKYYDINKIVLYNGIPDSEMKAGEKEKAGGFYCIKNLKFQYWDDANWTDFQNTELVENRKSIVNFDIVPSVTTYKIRLISTDGEPIRVVDIQAFGEEKGEVYSGDVDYQSDSNEPLKKETKATIEVKNKYIGQSMKYVGYNQGYYIPGGNISGWIQYSGVNSLRVWTALNEYIPNNAITIKDKITSLDKFEALKKQVIDNPESNPYIHWNVIKEIASNELVSTNSMVFDYALSELKNLNVDVVLQINSRNFTGDWQNSWEQWLKFYALAFYSAKTGDVEMFAMQNEPNHAHSNMKLDQYINALKIGSDAMRCAITDVNRIYGKSLKFKMVSPVTAGTNTNWWSSVIASVRTDYKGNSIDHNLLDIFSTHSYNIPAIGYKDKVSDIRKLLQSNHPLHEDFPIVFTEIGRWMNAYLIDREETMDSPSLFTEWAGIYANNMNNGSYGMWAFKFANTVSSTYPRGIKSGHHYIWKGKRFIEDSKENLALGKSTRAIGDSNKYKASNITDGDKSDNSAWIYHSEGDKWIEIDLQNRTELEGAVIYTGSSYGVYTSPDRVKNFNLQAWNGNNWIDVDGAEEKMCRYAQVLWQFKKPVSTNKVRLLIKDEGTVKVREIKLFGKGFMDEAKTSYDVSGIQRTGEVVRLFAKGFKNQRPLLETSVSVDDLDMNVNTSYDAAANMYYIWLVNRNKFDYDLTLNLAALGIDGSHMFIEEVSHKYYGELVETRNITKAHTISHKLPAQSVQLISIPGKAVKAKEVIASSNAVVKGGRYASQNFSTKSLAVSLDSRTLDNTSVSYIKFDVNNTNLSSLNKCIFNVNGYNSSDTTAYRIHVYAFSDKDWNEKSINWSNAPYLSRDETFMTNVGTQVDVVGQVAFYNKASNHQLDVTEFIKRKGSGTYTFVLIREPRELGDDYDKGKQCVVYSKESEFKPRLVFY